VGKSTRGQKAPEKNRQIFMEVVNGNPINRICELANVRPQTVYDKIDFFQEQCLKFLGDKERRLKEGFPIEKLYLSSDRQDYIVNWTHRKDKRTTQLSAVATADNGTGAVTFLVCISISTRMPIPSPRKQQLMLQATIMSNGPSVNSLDCG
jgi:hypothetical protein